MMWRYSRTWAHLSLCMPHRINVTFSTCLQYNFVRITTIHDSRRPKWMLEPCVFNSAHLRLRPFAAERCNPGKIGDSMSSPYLVLEFVVVGDRRFVVSGDKATPPAGRNTDRRWEQGKGHTRDRFQIKIVTDFLLRLNIL